MTQQQHTGNQPAPYDQQSTSTTSLLMNPVAFAQMYEVAKVMATGRMTVPKHLQGNVGDCLAIVMQSMQWGMNPFPVAQKTFQINGVLGYEAQLINAVITARAPTVDRLHYEWKGDWNRIIGRFKEVPAKNNPEEKRIVRDWTIKDEEGLSVRVWATLIGEDEPRELTLFLSQAGVRNSPLWGQDPKQQLAYLAIKRWSRLYCPDVILGVYTDDELSERVPERDVTEQPAPEPKKHSGSGALRDRLNTRSKKQDSNVVEGQAVEFDVAGTIDQINRATTLDQLSVIANHLPVNIGEPAKTDIKNAYRKRKTELAAAAVPAPEPEVVVMPEPEPVATSPMMPRESVNAIIAEMRNAQTDDDLTRIFETRVSAFVDSIDDVDFEELDLVYAARGAELNA